MGRDCLTALLAVLVLALASSAFGENPSPSVRVNETQRRCVSSNDCVLVQQRCDACNCGAAIHRAYLESHNTALEGLCARYTGPHCDKLCPPTAPTCFQGLCLMQPMGLGGTPPQPAD